MTLKGSLPQKGPKLPQISLSCLSGGDTQKSCVQYKFEAKRLKITPFITDRTFWGPKCPKSHRPTKGKVRNLGPYHLLDIITKEKLAKFQIKWTTASKVMRHRNFCAPKRVSPPKGVQIGPKLKFFVFQVGIPWNHVYNPNFKRNGLKFLDLWPTELSGTQNCPIPIGPFSDRNCKFAHCHILDIIKLHKPAKFQVY